jgi:hypothetical protein
MAVASNRNHLIHRLLFIFLVNPHFQFPLTPISFSLQGHSDTGHRHSFRPCSYYSRCSACHSSDIIRYLILAFAISRGIRVCSQYAIQVS